MDICSPEMDAGVFSNVDDNVCVVFKCYCKSRHGQRTLHVSTVDIKTKTSLTSTWGKGHMHT